MFFYKLIQRFKGHKERAVLYTLLRLPEIPPSENTA